MEPDAAALSERSVCPRTSPRAGGADPRSYRVDRRAWAGELSRIEPACEPARGLSAEAGSRAGSGGRIVSEEVGRDRSGCAWNAQGWRSLSAFRSGVSAGEAELYARGRRGGN